MRGWLPSTSTASLVSRIGTEAKPLKRASGTAHGNGIEIEPIAFGISAGSQVPKTAPRCPRRCNWRHHGVMRILYSSAWRYAIPVLVLLAVIVAVAMAGLMDWEPNP